MAKKLREREFLGSIVISVLVFLSVLTDKIPTQEGILALSVLWGTYNISRGLAKNEVRDYPCGCSDDGDV